MALFSLISVALKADGEKKWRGKKRGEGEGGQMASYPEFHLLPLS
jgi:hypothetical protein